jgi:hypothetical protein
MYGGAVGPGGGNGLRQSLNAREPLPYPQQQQHQQAHHQRQHNHPNNQRQNNHHPGQDNSNQMFMNPTPISHLIQPPVQKPMNPPNNANQSNQGQNRPINLSFTMDDVGRAIEMFSFRFSNWERVDLVDFDQNKRLYKCQFPDGSIQWLDLTKKPTRTLHDEVLYR